MKKSFLIVVSITFFLAACGDGDDGKDGADGESTVTGLLSANTAESLDISIDKVEINSAPVVTFSASDGSGVPIAGLTNEHVRFNIAKLVPGSNGDPSAWQNYINRVVGGKLQGTTESDGTLKDLGDGSYRYTFATNITNPAKVVCDNKHDCSYKPSLTHRVAMQISGFPATNPTFDFVPDGSKVTVKREIVKTETCNSCHNKLAIHGGGRVEIKYCVTCHNPGSTDPDTDNTVDFKVMIHKIHHGEELPSVAFGPDLIDGTGDDGTGEYKIIGYNSSVHDYSTVVFPQDIRNCNKCHNGSIAGTPQGNNWKTELSMAACGSCHDNIDFKKDGSDAGDDDPLGHSGGIVNDNSECVTCHAAGRIAGSVASRHRNPVKAWEDKFQFNIISVCGTPVPEDEGDPEPDCSGMPVTPTVTISVSDPSGAVSHTYGNLYDIAGPTNADRDPEFGAGASLNVLTAWESSDYNNDGGDGSRPSRANSMSVLTNATDVGDGTFTMTLDSLPIVSNSAGVAMEGHPRGESDPGSGNFDISIPVRGEVAYFGINGDPLVERRVAVDIAGKCDKCHDKLSLHGNNRADNAQLCVMCHNPRGTDIGRRAGVGIDGKFEESIDMKRLIHAIHAADRDEHGFRENGIVVYGYGGNAHDYSHVRFPGILNDCTACHNSGTYELSGKWETPLQNGILASTISTGPLVADQSDDLFTTPTAAVCSACHDTTLAKKHMETMGGAKFEVDQAAIDTSFETCAVCHGPDKIADLNLVHGIE